MKLNNKNIFIQLINAANNEALLSKVPHRTFLDLAIVYRSTESIITDVETFSEEELFFFGLNNTKRTFDLEIMPIYSAFEDYSNQYDDDLIMSMKTIPAEEQLYVATNKKTHTFGAAALLYPEMFAALASKLDSSLYILPSSIHELIVISASAFCGIEPQYLKMMVESVNFNEVAESEILSDNVYYYNKSTNEITICV